MYHVFRVTGKEDERINHAILSEAELTNFLLGIYKSEEGLECALKQGMLIIYEGEELTRVKPKFKREVSIEFDKE